MPRHLQHIKSSQVNKAPQASDLLYGEIAVNYAKGSETLYVKNSTNEIVPFVNGNIINDLDDRVTANTSNIGQIQSRLTTAETDIQSIERSIEDNELVTANALLDLNDRIETKANTIEVTASITQINQQITDINKTINDNEHVIAQALSVLNRKITEFEATLAAIEAALSEI